MKNQFGRLLPKSSFARGVSVLVAGTASAQLLLVLAAPILTRLYSPEDFGLLAVYTSLLALIGVISSLRYELAIPLPEDDGEAANVAVLCLILVVISAVLTGVLVLLMGSAIVAALGVAALAGYLWLLPVGVLLSGAYSVFDYWTVRTKRFTILAGTRLQQAVATIAIQLASFKFGGIALLLGQVIGQMGSTIILGLSALKSAGFKQINWTGVKKATSRYRRFPIFSTWEGLANTAGNQLPTFMFAALFSPAAAGLYMLTHRIMTLPMSLIGSAIGQVFFSNASEAHRAGKLGPLVAQLHAKLAHISLPPTILLMLMGPALFAFIFGEQWRQAGEFVKWMAPWFYFQFISSPISTVFAVTESLKQGVAFQIFLLIFRAAAIGFGSMVGDLHFAVVIFSIVSAMGYFCLILWLAHLSNFSFIMICRTNVSALFFALIVALPLIITLTFAGEEPYFWFAGLFFTLIILGIRYLFLFRQSNPR